ELQRTCKRLGIPYGRSAGIVFHDTRHSAVTNLVDSGTGEAAAMSITGHSDPSIFKRYHVRRDAAQAAPATRRTAHPAAQRGTPRTAPSIGKKCRTVQAHFRGTFAAILHDSTLPRDS